jgi:hypothetical protein
MSRQYPVALAVATALVLGLFAGGLRFFRLGDWPFFGDEFPTFREVDAFYHREEVEPSSQIARLPRLVPLSMWVQNGGYALFGRSEFGSRALPALLGTACVVLVAVGLRGPLGWAGATASAFLLAVWPMHLLESQFNRFYMTAAFAAAACQVAGAWAAHRRSPAFTALAVLAGVAALLAHSLLAVVLAGLGPALALAAWRGRQPLPWGNLGLVGLGVLGAAAYLVGHVLPLADGWNAAAHWGYGSAHSLAAAVNQLGWPVVALALLGAAWAFRRGGAQGGYWLTWGAVWLGASVTLPLVVTYQPAYTFPLGLAVIVLAGWAVGRIFEALRPFGLGLAAGWLAVACTFTLPGVVSYYQDGSRFDERTAAAFLAGRWRPGDRVASEQPEGLVYYAPQCDAVVPLTPGDPLPDLRHLDPTAARHWIVLCTGRSGHPADLGQWLAEHCTLRCEVRRRRLDYFDYAVEVFELNPLPPGSREAALPGHSVLNIGL